MNLIEKYKNLVEAKGSTFYDSGVGTTARVIPVNGKHVVKFFVNGKHQKYSDYDADNEKDAHEFAQDEMDHAKKEHSKNESTISERINMPQGHLETADPISDDSKEGKGHIKKMMGNRNPIEIIANILANKRGK